MTVYDEIRDERARQFAKHGDQSDLPDGTGPYEAAVSELLDLLVDIPDDPLNHGVEWAARERTKNASRNEGGDGSITFEHILTEEWAETIAATSGDELRAELIQVAAVAVQWVEAIDTRGADV